LFVSHPINWTPARFFYDRVRLTMRAVCGGSAFHTHERWFKKSDCAARKWDSIVPQLRTIELILHHRIHQSAASKLAHLQVS
jgi:hypothetical protein